ncbi:heme ABC exporter ATP-binding protein CcmA [Azohydromonas caseinilytica]|uniref:Heme ABC exporter ATP-binding protein CcmA n=1 Tax=Azohydromonas caseinilytica TaxID=2728836 RepID=A0A848FGM6_9BURK|nr:heme ABC exporter ATP-binding protein CcmA [Azohydromonas caseinilytica]NML18412.1 heme ABC exporter ATP-binding protein CcmA [Azohydromonas caseinilytica]
MLDITDLQLVRGGRLLCEGFNLRLLAGQALLVEGANGAGKTTLLRSLAGLQPLHAQQLRWQGFEGRAAREAMCLDLCFIGHREGLHEALTPVENLDHLLRLGGEAQTTGRIEQALQGAGLGALVRAPVRRLSQGQRRRVALTRLVLTRRKLWLLDEPLAALDEAARLDFTVRLALHLERGGLALISTHDPWPSSAPSMPRLHLPAPLPQAA